MHPSDQTHKHNNHPIAKIRNEFIPSYFTPQSNTPSVFVIFVLTVLPISLPPPQPAEPRHRADRPMVLLASPSSPRQLHRCSSLPRLKPTSLDTAFLQIQAITVEPPAGYGVVVVRPAHIESMATRPTPSSPRSALFSSKFRFIWHGRMESESGWCLSWHDLAWTVKKTFVRS